MANRRAKTTKKQTPTLTWPGKHPPQPGLEAGGHPLGARAPSPPAQLVEVYSPGDGVTEGGDAAGDSSGAAQNLLFHGDNRAVLTHLLASGYGGRVKLIYIDPPFDSGVHYQRKVRLRGPKAPTMQTSAGHVFGAQPQYSDRWDEYSYLQFIYERLPLLRDLLSEDGSLWLHCDHRQMHHLRVLLQEVFGAENYLNTVVWRSQVARGAKVNAFYFPFSAHFLEIFAKNRQAPTTWNLVKKQIVLSETEAARQFMRDQRGFFRTSDPGAYTFASLKALHAEGRLYAPYNGDIVIDESSQRVYASNGGNIGVKYYLRDLGRGKWAVERAIDNLWVDIPGLGTTPGEDLGYPTQKTEALLDRIIRTSTNPGDLVLDCFAGSGTTLAVAQRLGRRWIGCDNNDGAILTARRRLQAQKPSSATDVGFTLYRMSDREGLTQSDSARLEAQIMAIRNPDDAAEVNVQILEVVSPGVAALLATSKGNDHRPVNDWRAVVDCVAIDPCYDGQVFRPTIVDAPLKKSAQVKGSYSFKTPVAPGQVAVRITDVLGEEILIIRGID
jgi:DNA modification methylase